MQASLDNQLFKEKKLLLMQYMVYIATKKTHVIYSQDIFIGGKLKLKVKIFVQLVLGFSMFKYFKSTFFWQKKKQKKEYRQQKQQRNHFNKSITTHLLDFVNLCIKSSVSAITLHLFSSFEIFKLLRKSVRIIFFIHKQQ